MAKIDAPNVEGSGRAVARALDFLVPVVGSTAFVAAGLGFWGALAGGLIGAWCRWFFAEVKREPLLPTMLSHAVAPAEDFQLLSALPVPVLLIATDGTITCANVTAEHLLARVVRGLHISQVFRAPAVLTAVEAGLHGAIPADFEFRVRAPREMILRATIRAISPDGSRGIALTLKDETDRLLVQETRSDFVANASHELRTPLAAISGLVETLQGAAKDDPAAQERFLGMIAKQSDRMTRLINDLLSLSRVEADENILPTTKQDFGQILAEAVAAILPAAETANTRIETEIPTNLPAVRGSRDELVQIFVNLIENAIKYAGSAGPVRILAEQKLDKIYVSVSDSGAGIEPENIPRLTERFFRIDSADSCARGGTGLGLAIVKHIVNRHRGSLEIVSNPGEGSVFTVKLPCASMHDA